MTQNSPAYPELPEHTKLFIPPCVILLFFKYHLITILPFCQCQFSLFQAVVIASFHVLRGKTGFCRRIIDRLRGPVFLSLIQGEYFGFQIHMILQFYRAVRFIRPFDGRRSVALDPHDKAAAFVHPSSLQRIRSKKRISKKYGDDNDQYR